MNRTFAVLREQRWALWLIMLAVLALRLLLWAQPLHQPANDEIEYITVARDLLAGRGWQFYTHYDWLRAPLYPLWLAGSLWLAGGDLHRAALPNIALSTATVYLGYRLAWRLVGPRSALVAAGMGAILWTQATFASLYMAETLFTFLFTAGLLLLCRFRDQPRGRVLVLAGLCFGLAALTRSVVLAWVPLLAVWLAWSMWRTAGWFRSACWAGLLLACVMLAIAPWSARNYLAYGRIIPVETGLSYNMWVFNEPHADLSTIRRELRAIPNPATRSDYANAQGMARLHEDPAILLRKLWPNWVYLLRVRPIEDRFLQENYKSDVQLPSFAAALLFDDALYGLLILAGTTGLLCRRPLSFGQGACAIWLAYVVGTTLLTHGEARYHHFFFPVLLPFTAWTLTHAADAWRSARSAPWRTAGLLAVWVLLAGTVLGTYPWRWAETNVVRGWYVLAGDVAWRAGQHTAALANYQRATEAQRTPVSWLRIGDLLRADGQLAAASTAYRKALAIERSYVPASARLGDVLRALGDPRAARDAFEGSYTSEQATLDWSWRELRPPPHATLDVGDGLDFGYVDGMYAAEDVQGASARWTDGVGMVRVAAPARGAGVLALRLAAPWPSLQPVQAVVCVARQCWPLTLQAGWRTYVLPFDAPPGGTMLVQIRSATFAAPDGRRLGVLVDGAHAEETR